MLNWSREEVHEVVDGRNVYTTYEWAFCPGCGARYELREINFDGRAVPDGAECECGDSLAGTLYGWPDTPTRP